MGDAQTGAETWPRCETEKNPPNKVDESAQILLVTDREAENMRVSLHSAQNSSTCF